MMVSCQHGARDEAGWAWVAARSRSGSKSLDIARPIAANGCVPSSRPKANPSCHVVPTLAAVLCCAFACATRDRAPEASAVPSAAGPAAVASNAASTSGKPADRDAPDASTPLVPDSGEHRLAQSASGPDGGSKAVPSISSPCVLHAGQGKRKTRTIRRPGAATAQISRASCSANAECIATKGTDTVGDGFVRLDCTERSCTCSFEPSAPAPAKPWTSSFEISSPCSTSGQALQLIVERCMHGMVVAHP